MTLALLLVPALLLAACSGDDAPVTAGAGPDGTAAGAAPDGTAAAPAPDGATRYRGTVTVLESPDHGPQLCTTVAESYPPQCSGPDVEGWDWDAVDDEESAAGTTWGTWTVTGTWDGERLTLTEPPAPASPDEASAGGWASDLTTPCEPPPGGWAPVDEATATDDALGAALSYAQVQPGFAGAWLDQSVNPESAGRRSDEARMNDPTRLVLNVRFTDDLDRHRDELRALWGGALCVSRAERTLAELHAIAAEVQDELDSDIGGVDQVQGVVHVRVWVAPPGLQGELDQRYGEGVVRLDPVLRPV